MQESLPEHSQIHLFSLSGPVGIFRLLSRAQQKSHLHIVALTDTSTLPQCKLIYGHPHSVSTILLRAAASSI